MRGPARLGTLLLLMAFLASCGGPDESAGQTQDEPPRISRQEAEEAFIIVYSAAVNAARNDALGLVEEGVLADRRAGTVRFDAYSLSAYGSPYTSISGFLESTDDVALAGTVALEGGSIAEFSFTMPRFAEGGNRVVVEVVADGDRFDLEFVGQDIDP